MEPRPAATLPGLSVWVWGPTMWSVLQTLALQCDVVNERMFVASDIENFFKHLQPLLPCKYCSSSYGCFLEEVCKERNETVAEAFRSRHMVSFVFDLHNKVNFKLAKQRWNEIVGVMKMRLSEQTCRELLTCESSDMDIAKLVDKSPILSTVHKRNDIFKYEPLNLEALGLIVVALAQRAPQNNTEWNFILFLCTVSKLLESMETPRSKRFGKLLEHPLTMLRGEMGTGSNARSLRALISASFQLIEPPVSFQDFEAQFYQRVSLMRASLCGAGTCK